MSSDGSIFGLYQLKETCASTCQRMYSEVFTNMEYLLYNFNIEDDISLWVWM